LTIITVTIPRSTAFDTTVPTSVAMGDTAATGSAVTAARRDHLHNVFAVATQANMEAATTSTVPVVPAVAKFAPSAVKGWAQVDQTGTQSITVSYNIASIADGGAGVTTFTFSTAFSSNNYPMVVGAGSHTARVRQAALSTTAQNMVCVDNDTSGSSHGQVDDETACMMIVGDQ